MECIVRDIIDINTKKARVVLDNDVQFALYKGEIRRFHINIGESLEDGVYENIIGEILPKRARERCLNLLDSRNMTEYELRSKLRAGFYPAEIIDDTITKLLKHRLIDDEYYATLYIESHQNVKSKRQMLQYLTNKGIDRELLLNVLSEVTIDEESSIRRLMDKKRINPDISTREELNKFCMYLMRKGYNYELIKKVVR